MKRSKLIRIKNPPNNISRVRFLSGEAAENLGNLGEVDFFACEVVSKSEQKKCFQKMIFIHINKTVCYPEIGQEMGIQGKVYMRFVIEKDGSITNIEVLRSPDRNLEKEALRIINKLPKMTPGKQRGRPVRVPFSIPITFKLN
jgi:protein TonB